MRYFIEFAYLGTAYHGWQRQPNAISVQEVLEQRMSTLLGQPLEVVAAGRTDAGVHARKMIAHFDWADSELPGDFSKRLNAFLPEDISIYAIQAVPEQAHARFDAVSRTYKYNIVQRKNPFRLHDAYWVKTPLDIEAMNRAAAFMLTFKDFKCFSRSHTDVKTFLCDIREATWALEGEALVFTITADRFLRNMVRAVVGTLLQVGKGEMTPEDVKTIIKSRDRAKAGASVPAKGLYLTEILYPQSIYPNG
jgi:tRNA pseudouridine38-40 synthase